MKRGIFKLLLMGLVSLAISSQAQAQPILVGSTYDLTAANGWDGTQAQQSTEENVNWLADFYDGTIDDASTLPYPLELLAKWDDTGGWETGGDLGITGDFEGTEGDWTLPDGWDTFPLYFSIKADSAFELYYADSALTASWNTSGIGNGNHDLSHIDFWSASQTPPTPIPEPATMLLFGTGLAGLARLRSRTRKA